MVQTFLIYLSGGWIALEMTDYFISKYDLSTKISEILSIILLFGLPIAIFLAWYLSREKDGGREIDPDRRPYQKLQGFIRYLIKKSWFSIPGVVLILLLILTGIRFIYLQKKKKWGIEQALPQMQNMMHDWDFVNAFQLAKQVVKYIPDDPEFMRIDSLITARITILTDPEGADVYFKLYSDVKEEWISLGTTPLSHLAMPNRTMYRWKLVKPGYEDVYAVSSTFEDTLYRTMHKSGIIPVGMVYVEGVYTETGWDFDAEGMNEFFIDKYEVSNRQFKEFIESGGYRNPEFWQHDFVRDNEILDFEEALNYMVDLTGRPGPATWEAGGFPDGQEDYPVNGISWYEAAAYAQYAGKRLPTLSHWRGSAGLGYPGYRYSLGSNLIPLSNMEGKGPEPVGRNPGLSSFGTYDMFGNVREWCFNESPSGRIIQGGAWNDVTYMSTNISQVPHFDRSAKNGFRCVIFPDGDRVPDKFVMPIGL